MSEYFKENRTEAGHGQRSLRGGAVTLAARAVNAGLQIGSVLVLARLLSPEDYGLVSMVVALTGFAPMLVDLGTRDAVVQRSRITQEEVSALFWTTVAIGFGLTAIAVASAPVIAQFYGEPRLKTITMVSAVSFVASALTCQHHALLRRAMKFRELAVVEVGSNLLSAAAAILMAVYGFAYWALVIRPVLMNLFTASGVWACCRWAPRRPVVTRGVKEMLRFGINLAGFTVTDFGGKSCDKVAIGYRIGAQGLGYYQNAMFVYDNLLDVLVLPLHQVAVSGLSKMRNDLKELRRVWAKALSTLLFYSMPAFGLLAVTSRDVIVLLLGAKWTAAGTLLSILALRGIPHAVERTLGWLHVTAGRTDRWMRWGIFAGCFQLAALFCGLPFGPTGVVIGYVVSMFLLFIPAIVYAGQPLGIGTRDVCKVVWRPIASSLIAAATGFVLRSSMLTGTSGIVRTVVLAMVYVTLYLALVVGLFRVRMPIRVSLELIRSYLPARIARYLRTPRFIEAHSYEHT